MLTNYALDKPFVPTHTRRKDDFPVMLYGQTENDTVYRVQFGEVDRMTACSTARFNEAFRREAVGMTSLDEFLDEENLK